MTRFPTAKGTNLEGRKFHLPEDFEGDYNLVLIAFEQWQQAQVDTWMPFANTLKAQFPALHVYELPTIQKMGWLAERMVDMGMRAGIPDVTTREATITLYLDLDAFCRALAIPTTRTIVALVVDGQGEVVWRADGAYTPQAGAALTTLLGSVMAV